MNTPTPEEREMLLEMPAARALIAEAVADEREACLTIVKELTPCDPSDSRYQGALEACGRIAAAILARDTS